MCGRYELHSDIARVMEAFGAEGAGLELSPRYNIAPTQDVPIVVNRGEVNRLVLARWGLVPRWARDTRIGNRMINARAETLNEKRVFKELLKSSRCIVAADGFYEWRKEGRRRVPMYVTLRGRQPFGFAGLHSAWRDPDGKEIETFTIVTTAANELLSRIHDRMPAILARKDEATWLDPEAGSREELEAMLGPYPGGEMEIYEVSSMVNRPANDSAELIRRVG